MSSHAHFEHHQISVHPAADGASVLDREAYRTASWIVISVVSVAALYLAVAESLSKAAALAVLVLVGGSLISSRKRLPSLFPLLFLIAAVVNSAGYLFDLWKRPLWFDEVVHAFTSFTIMAALGWIGLSRTRINVPGKSGLFIAAVVGLGIVLGVAWEVFEWIIGIIGGPADTIVDLIMDTIGAVLAGLFCAWAASQERRTSARGA